MKAAAPIAHKTENFHGLFVHFGFQMLCPGPFRDSAVAEVQRVAVTDSRSHKPKFIDRTNPPPHCSNPRTEWAVAPGKSGRVLRAEHPNSPRNSTCLPPPLRVPRRNQKK
jgi:hypothetical protein